MFMRNNKDKFYIKKYNMIKTYSISDYNIILAIVPVLIIGSYLTYSILFSSPSIADEGGAPDPSIADQRRDDVDNLPTPITDKPTAAPAIAEEAGDLIQDEELSAPPSLDGDRSLEGDLEFSPLRGCDSSADGDIEDMYLSSNTATPTAATPPFIKIANYN